MTTQKTLNPDQIVKLKAAIKEIDNYYDQIDAAKLAMKDITDQMHEDIGISKKLLNKMAKTYHDEDFDMVIEEMEDFRATYETVTGKN